jgi:rubrerythrin
MGRRLLPNTLPELYAHAISVEREAAKRFAELERSMRDAGIDHLAEEFAKIGNEEREQYEALSLGTADRKLPELRAWEYAWHFLGPHAEIAAPQPKNARDALKLALATERRAQNFYTDVAEHSMNDSVCAFAAEMAVDEQRHVTRLEALLAREPEPAKVESADDVDGVTQP